MNKSVQVCDWGIIAYKDAWEAQTELFEKVIAQKVQNRKLSPDNKEKTSNYLIFCEHPHVYTLGKSGKTSHLLLSKEQLETKKISYYPSNRGGDITYHGFGQLVCYPILDLDNFFTDIHRYLRFLEEAIIRTLAEYNLQAGRIEKLTGVWLDSEIQENPRKICAMGVKASRWVTMHGLALNINTDLSYFEHIIPCGIQDKAVTSMAKELNQEIAIHEVKSKLQVSKHCSLPPVQLAYGQDEINTS